MTKKPFRWSFSALKDFEKCPRLYQWSRAEGRPRKSSPALDRGNLVHKRIEDYLLGRIPLLDPMFAKFADYIESIKKAPGLEVEGFWAFDRAWQPVNDVPWFVVKQDVLHRVGRTKARVVDWKTGGIYGENAEQVRFYGTTALCRHPELKEVEVELCYLDHKQAHSEVIKRRNIDITIADLTARAGRIENETKFKPTPGRACGYCPFGKSKYGDKTCESAA